MGAVGWCGCEAGKSNASLRRARNKCVPGRLVAGSCRSMSGPLPSDRTVRPAVEVVDSAVQAAAHSHNHNFITQYKMRNSGKINQLIIV